MSYTGDWYDDNWTSNESYRYGSRSSRSVPLSRIMNELNITQESLNYSAEFKNLTREDMDMVNDLFESADESITQWIDAAESSRESISQEDKRAYEGVKKAKGKEILKKIKQVIERIIIAIGNAIRTVITYVKGKTAKAQTKYYEKHKGEIQAGLRANGSEVNFKGVIIRGGRGGISDKILNLMDSISGYWSGQFSKLSTTLSKAAEKNSFDERENKSFMKNVARVESRLLSLIGASGTSDSALKTAKQFTQALYKSIYGSETQTMGEEKVSSQFKNQKAFEILGSNPLSRSLKLVGGTRAILKEIKNIKKRSFEKSDRQTIAKIRIYLKSVNHSVLSVMFTLSSIFFKERAYAMSAMRKIIRKAPEKTT